MSMVPLLALLVMAGAGCVAVAATTVTVRAQLPAVRRLLAESWALAAEREFLVQITAKSAPATAQVAVRQRRSPVRVIRPLPAAAVRPLRAAA